MLTPATQPVYRRLRRTRTRPWLASLATRKINGTYLRLSDLIETLLIERGELEASDMVRKVRMMGKLEAKREVFRHLKPSMVH